MIEITVIDVESKELHKMEETKEKETKETETKEKQLKLSTIRIVVISETCLLIIRHKKEVMQVDPLIYYFYYIFVFALKMSVAGQVYLFAAFAREICTRICVCACVCVCVHM